MGASLITFQQGRNAFRLFDSSDEAKHILALASAILREQVKRAQIGPVCGRQTDLVDSLQGLQRHEIVVAGWAQDGNLAHRDPQETSAASRCDAAFFRRLAEGDAIPSKASIDFPTIVVSLLTVAC